MHELGIARDLFDIVLQKSKENNLKKVTKISIKLGEAAGIETDFLKHSFIDHIIPGSIAAGCEFEIIVERVKVKCKKCSKEFSSKDMKMNCPSCDGTDIEIISGNNIYVASIEGE
ncbi:MAG: hydrogenase maturation nickel metallochaperone HypA [Elusimicrobia bacterium]|nr:hydrogenase maturation nickel metallochaperone HypA [Elusimicrobiota bacterium]